MYRRRTSAARDEAKFACIEWIEGFHDRRRPHSSIGYRHPADVMADSREGWRREAVSWRHSVRNLDTLHSSRGAAFWAPRLVRPAPFLTKRLYGRGVASACRVQVFGFSGGGGALWGSLGGAAAPPGREGGPADGCPGSRDGRAPLRLPANHVRPLSDEFSSRSRIGRKRGPCGRLCVTQEVCSKRLFSTDLPTTSTAERPAPTTAGGRTPWVGRPRRRQAASAPLRAMALRNGPFGRGAAPCRRQARKRRFPSGL